MYSYNDENRIKTASVRNYRLSIMNSFWIFWDGDAIALIGYCVRARCLFCLFVVCVACGY